MDLLSLQAVERTAVDNCFVRLPPHVARSLWEKQRRETSGLFRFDSKDSSWSIDNEDGTSDRCDSGIEFLPLAITFPSTGRTIYLSYNGGDSAAESVIQLPFGSITQQHDGHEQQQQQQEDSNSPSSTTTTTVHVTALAAIDTLPTVIVQPVSYNDWIRLELDATWLEEGGFLAQVSLVYPEQRLFLALPDGATAQVQVVTDLCGRLTAHATQVVVRPVPSPPARQWHVWPSWKDLVGNAVAMRAVAAATAEASSVPHIDTPPPKTVLVHPESWQTSCRTGLARVRTREESDSRSAVVRVQMSDQVSVDAIVMHPLLRQTLSLPLFDAASHVVTMEPLHGADIELAKSRFSDIAVRSTAAAFWRCVCLERKRRVASYRTPDILDGMQDAATVQPSVVLPTVHHLPPDTPIQVGDLFRSCQADDDGTSEGHHLLQLWSKDAAALEDSFVLANDLEKILAHHEASLLQEGDSTTITSCEGILHGPLLPRRHVIFRNALHIAQEEAIHRRRFVLTGDRGSGKTHVACTVAAVARMRFGSATLYINCRTLRDSSRRMQTILQELSEVLEEAATTPSKKACCISCCVILDDIDLIAPQVTSDDSTVSSGSHQGAPNPAQSAEMMQSNLIAQVLARKLQRLPDSVLVVATCRSLDSVSAYLVAAGAFDRSTSVPACDGDQRRQLFGAFLNNDPTATINDCFKSLDDKKTSMFRPRDIEKLAQRVKLRMTLTDVEGADTLLEAELANGFVPLSQLGVVDSEDQSQGDVEWSGLGGLFKAKAQLQSSVLRPSRYQKIYAKAKIRTPRGVLLYGFPGTGKTACAHALAREGGFALIKCKGPEILDKYIGASEAKVRELFAKAAAAAPSILFLDEIDALAPRRGSDHTGVTDRVVNQLLTFLDGVEDFASNGNVYIIAATSRPDKVDPALLRPGRLERHVYFGCENTAEETEDLLLKVSMRFDVEAEVSNWIASRYDNDHSIAPKLQRLCAADMLSMFRNARLLAINDAIAADCVETMSLNIEHIKRSVAAVKASLTRADRELLSNTYSKFGGLVRPISTSPASSGSQLVALR